MQYCGWSQKPEEALSVRAVNSHTPAYECISCGADKQYGQVKNSCSPSCLWWYTLHYLYLFAYTGREYSLGEIHVLSLRFGQKS